MREAALNPETMPPIAAEPPDLIDILLVMKPPEAQFCAAALHRCISSLRIARAGTVDDCLAATSKAAPNARIIAFSTAVIVPASVLQAYPGGGYNFHPGPPEYPGNRPSAFASYDQATQFGVTLHRMLPRVDEGEIIDCNRFPLKPSLTAGAIAIEAYQRLARLFLINAGKLARLDAPLQGNGETWSGRKTTMADYDAMRALPRDADAHELKRRSRAFTWIYTPL